LGFGAGRSRSPSSFAEARLARAEAAALSFGAGKSSRASLLSGAPNAPVLLPSENGGAMRAAPPCSTPGEVSFSAGSAA
jgi:hypothetical protein